jgi:hypothetical protein
MTDRRSARINDGRASSGSGGKPPKGQRAHQMRKAAKRLADEYVADREAKLPRKNGHPSIYSEKLAEEICAHIAEGGTVSGFCEDPDKPGVSTIYLWLSREPGFMDAYARARQARALSRIDEADAVVADVRAGKLEPHAARVILDHFRWLAAKENPVFFGDRVQTELVVPGAPRRFDAAELARRVAHYLEVARMREEGLLIDAKPVVEIEEVFEGGSGDPGEG